MRILAGVFNAFLVTLAMDFHVPILDAWQSYRPNHRDALFFELNRTIHHSNSMGHFCFVVPVRESLFRCDTIRQKVQNFIDKELTPEQAAFLQPKLQRLTDNIMAFDPFRSDRPSPDFNNIHQRQKRAVFSTTKAKRSARKKRSEVQKVLSRVRRSWNINLDPTTAFHEFFSGVFNLIHAPSLKQMRDELGEVVHTMNSSFTHMAYLGMKQARAIKLVSVEQQEIKSELQLLFKMFAASELLDDGVDQSDDVLGWLVDLSRGQMPRLLSPADILTALEDLQHKADMHEGKKLLLNHVNPLDLYRLPATTMTQDDGNVEVCVHIPMVDHTNGFSATHFVNAPFKSESGESVRFESPSGMLGMRGVLDPDKEFLFVPDEDYEARCLNILAHTLCMGTVHRSVSDSCPASLYALKYMDPEEVLECQRWDGDNCDENHENEQVQCDLEQFVGHFSPKVVSDNMILFTHNDTQVEINCDDQKRVKTINGRSILQLEPGCTVKSAKWLEAMPALEGPKVVVETKTFDVRNLRDIPIAMPTRNSSAIANLTSDLSGTRQEMANVTDELADLVEDQEAMANDVADLVGGHESVVSDLAEVAVDIDELEKGYEEVISNVTKNLQDIGSVKKEVRELREHDQQWFDRGDQISISVSGIVFFLGVCFVIFLWRRAGVPA